MVAQTGQEGFLFYVMFWTILAMMMVLIYSLKQVIVTQRYIRNLDSNIEKLVKKTLAEEDEILKAEKAILKSEKRIIRDVEKK